MPTEMNFILSKFYVSETKYIETKNNAALFSSKTARYQREPIFYIYSFREVQLAVFSRVDVLLINT